MRRILPVALALTVLAPVLRGGRLDAQGRFGDEETRLLREAAALESEGELDGAETALRRLLEIDPVSTGGIYALERVLRAKGELESLLVPVDRYLSRREDSGIRSLKLQLLVEADSIDAMVEEADRWIGRAPRDELAYMEVARAYEAAFGPDRALEVLLDGRRRLGGNALALAMGDYFAARGDLDAAVEEWANAIGPDGSDMLSVRRRIESLPEGENEAGRRVVRIVADSDAVGRRRAATQLAIELGLTEEALELAQREASTLDGDARSAYLREVSVAATAAGVAEVASWAFEELGRRTEDPDDRRVLDQRRAEAALESGDTIAALDAFDRVARSLPTTSSERRQVEGRAIRIAAEAAEMDRLRTLYAAFRETYPSAGELDALAATTASALIVWGDVEGAAEVLTGVQGPRSSLERAYLLLGSGQIDVGRNLLMEAAVGLPPAEATDVIQLMGILSRVSAPGAQALSNTVVKAHVGRGATASLELADQAFDLPPGDQPILLAEAARIADRAGAPEAAADIRKSLVAEYPAAPEAGEASLALARHLAGPGGDADGARRLLEDLITREPGAAVVPEARLELERLRSRS